MKGIILAGGHGTRLFPLTSYISKQLLPIYDKPMIYYSLSTLMLAGIRDVLLISSSRDLQTYENVLGNGDNFGINIEYAPQESPNGIAESFLIGENFIEGNKVALILGDNIFYGANLTKILIERSTFKSGACIFACKVNNPSDFGVLEFNQQNLPISIHEKPTNPPSNFAVTGLYFYDSKVVDFAKKLSPSKRGELEITDINNMYLKQNELYVEKMPRGVTWLDTGTVDSLIEAGNFVQIIEKRQGIKIACLEEIALNNGWITKNQIEINLSQNNHKSSYSLYLKELL